MAGRSTAALLLVITCGLTLSCNRPNWNDPVNAYLSFARAMQKADVKLAWSALSAESQKVLGDKAKALAAASDGGVTEEPIALFFAFGTGAPAVREVTLVKQEGNSAVVSVVPDNGPAREVRMVQEQGGWKLDVTQALKD